MGEELVFQKDALNANRRTHFVPMKTALSSNLHEIQIECRSTASSDTKKKFADQKHEKHQFGIKINQFFHHISGKRLLFSHIGACPILISLFIGIYPSSINFAPSF